MDAFFLRVLTTACVISALLAVLLFPARRWMQRRYAPQVRWGLWCGLAAVLLFGTCFSGFAAIPETIWEFPDYTITLPSKPVSVPEVPRSPEPVSPGSPTESQSPSDLPGTLQNDVVAPEDLPAAAEAAAERTFSLTAIAGFFWLAGAAGIALWQWLRYLHTRRKFFAASSPTDAFTQEVLKMGVRAYVRVLPGLECPMALGIFRPVVFLPQGDVSPLAIRHELTHIKRRDLAGKALLFLACVFYWFDPLVWQMDRVAGEDMEAACDAQLTRDMTTAEKRGYGELLLSAAAGRSASPLSTRFGGSKKQMKSRLTQLFRPGKSSRMLTGALLCAAFLVTALVACQSSGGHSAVAVEDAVLYATFGYTQQPEDTDYRELTLTLVDFVPGADWVGGSYGSVTIPVSEDIRLSGIRVGEGEWKKRLFNFLFAPLLRSYALPGTTNILRVEVHAGVITAMDWYEGVTYVGGVLWQDGDYGEAFPCVLRLPGSWRDQFDTETMLGRDGQGRVTDYSVEFYRKGTRELLFTLKAWKEADFRAQYGDEDAALGEQGIWVLGSGGGWYFCGEAAQSAASDDDMVKDLLAQSGETCLVWLGPESYSSAQYGFTLDLPDSWQGHYYAEETLQGVDFYYRSDGALLCSLIIRTEPASQEEESVGRVKLAGCENGWYIYLSMPQSVPANQFEDMGQGLRYQRMYQDFLRLFEKDAWNLAFAQGADAVSPALPVAAEMDPETRAAFAGVLKNLLESGILPDGRQLEAWEPHDSGNSFAVADVDADGKEELILYYVTADMAGMCGYVMGYDAGSSIHIQLKEFPSMEFYGNGAVKAMLSHNQTGGNLWPYTLYTYLPESDSYQQIAIVHAWDKSLRSTNEWGESFPDTADRSGTGTVYYVEPDSWEESDPIDEADYLAWEENALEGSSQLTLSFLPLTRESIAVLEG